MGRIEPDLFGYGYTVYGDDGSKEHFTKALFSDDWVGKRALR